MHHCNKCNQQLNNDNWTPGRQKVGNYICQTCAAPMRKKSYESRKIVELAVSRKLRKLYKQKVFDFYGGRCVSCGIDDLKKLTIDHIDNSGGKHRRSGVDDIYRWLFLNNFPKDNYQILCYNCNCSKGIQFKDKYHLKNKITVMNAYGGSCVSCGISDVRYLTIDHLNNDGAEQRRNLGCGKGTTMYRWLIKNLFPKNLGLQVLCYNCNCSKLTKD